MESPLLREREEEVGLPRTISPFTFTYQISSPSPMVGEGGERHLQGRKCQSGHEYFLAILAPLTLSSLQLQYRTELTEHEHRIRRDEAEIPAFSLTNWMIGKGT